MKERKWSIRQQVIDDSELNGLMLHFYCNQIGEPCLQLSGKSLPFGNRDISFNIQGNETGRGTGVGPMSDPENPHYPGLFEDEPTDDQLKQALVEVGFETKHLGLMHLSLPEADLGLTLEVSPDSYLVGAWNSSHENYGIEIPCKDFAAAVRLALCLVEVCK